jgi:dephospho-CoA kinase
MAAAGPYIVGLTGGIGSGKSTVAELFAAQGVPVVDTDAIAHALTAAGGAGMAPIRAAFGPAVLTADGALDRTAMRRLVFADPEARRRLEAILHPLIRAESARQCVAAGGPYVVLMVPLLVESGSYAERCRRVLVVDCREETQVARVMARSALSADEARAIMASQASRAERLSAADDVVDNDGPASNLPPQVGRLHQMYCQAAINVQNEG